MAWWNAWLSGWFRLLGRSYSAADRAVEADARISLNKLMEEIREAHRDWENARRHFEYASGKDQIDYAIFAIEAAEKRYEMLLRHAKNLQVDWKVRQQEADAG
ncbi:DUF2508 family protein [Paenibacillus sambharensis]|uniref:DUF2508 family protein n=1 Tax=Paenibacillus sambharensis TaxID=1803190 RepID=UPI001FEC8130|nr:DUF2508 family protein [Paenibacillus sambharensis]